MAAQNRPTPQDAPNGRRGRLLAVGILAAALIAVAPACKEEPDRAEVGYGLEGTGVSTGFQAKMKHRCELDEKVSDPIEGTAEYAVHQALKSALTELAEGASDDEAFATFFAEFSKDKKKNWVRSQYWKAARKNASKFMPEDWEAGTPVEYRLCTREEQGDDKLKITILSYDPDKNNHPIKLKKDDAGKWRLSAWSP